MFSAIQYRPLKRCQHWQSSLKERIQGDLVQSHGLEFGAPCPETSWPSADKPLTVGWITLAFLQMHWDYHHVTDLLISHLKTSATQEGWTHHIQVRGLCVCVLKYHHIELLCKNSADWSLRQFFSMLSVFSPLADGFDTELLALKAEIRALVYARRSKEEKRGRGSNIELQYMFLSLEQKSWSERYKGCLPDWQQDWNKSTSKAFSFLHVLYWKRIN